MKEKLKYSKYKNELKKYQILVGRIASARMITFIIMIISFIGKYYYTNILLNILFILNLIAFILLIIIHEKYYKKYDYYEKYISIIETYIKRENGTWTDFKDKGEDFLKNSPYYYKDLDIFGEYSLFQLINICKTNGGREKLKNKLSNQQLSSNELKKEQEAINEISNNINFMIDLTILLLPFDNKNIHLKQVFSNITNTFKKSNDKIIAIVASIICIIFLILSLLNKISINYFYGIFLFNYMISTLYIIIFKEDYSNLEKIIKNYKAISNIFNLYKETNFSSIKLNKIKKEIDNASKNDKKLKNLDSLNSLRSNIISNFLLNGLFCINIFILDSFNNFENKNMDTIIKGIEDIEELEAIVSLANIGVLFDNKCLPTLEDKVSITFENLIHPLLGEKKCIPNSFESKAEINIITGSNMGGKTSFLRTVGLNLILMNSGTFVCAKTFHASYFKIFTSMRVNDDIKNGISTFYGELLRVKEMIEYLDKGNMLVLIDEIFKGTNYQDRIYGAKEVIKRLTNNKTTVLLTTHDFELCEEKNIKNYHVKESYENDKIIFDYKIRKGKCSSTNARYLMTKLKIIAK